jgi:F-type H+-transporting ATPase subunit b
MGENTQEKKSLLSKIPAAFWVLMFCWLVVGYVLSKILNKMGMPEGVSPSATAWQLADVLILLTILYYAAKSAVLKTLADRKKEISESIDTYKNMLAEARKNYEEIESKLNFIEKEYEQMEVQARQDFEKEKTRILEETKKLIERIKNEAEFTAKQEIKGAEARLKDDAVNAALKIAEEILKKKVTDKEEMKLSEEYLREVESGAQR